MHETQKPASILSAEKHIHSVLNQQSYPGLCKLREIQLTHKYEK